MGFLSWLKSKFPDDPELIPDGAEISVPAERLRLNNVMGTTSITAAKEPPGMDFVVRSSLGDQKFRTVGGGSEVAEDLGEGEPLAEIDEFAAILEKPLAQLQQELHWMTHEVAVECCRLTLECYLDSLNTTPEQAASRLTQIAEKAGIIGPAPTEASS